MPTDQVGDIKAAVAFLLGEPSIDQNRIAVMGLLTGVVLIVGANVSKVVPVSTSVPVTQPDSATTSPTSPSTNPSTGAAVGSTSTTPVSAASADNSCTY